MSALASLRLPVLAALVATVAVAQGNRRPEAFQLAIGLQQRGLHDEAVSYLERFVAESPRHALVPEAYYRLAQSRSELRQDDRAIAALREALKRGGNDFELRPEALYRLGNLLQAKDDQKGALSAFSQLGKAVADDHYLAAAAAYAEGEAQRDLGDDEKAQASFVRAARLSVGEQKGFRFPSLYQAGFASLRRQQFEAAGAAFAAAGDAAPDAAAKAECDYLVGDANLRLGRYDPAEAAFERARKAGSEFADDAQYGLGWVAIGRGDRKAAIAAFGRVVERHADSPFAGNARLERGRCYYQEKDYERARRELEPLVQEAGNPLMQEARELLGLCALASGAGADAVATLQQALEKADAADRPRLSFALGEALANLQRWEEALAAYGAVGAEVDAGLRGDAMYGACHALHELGRHEDSIAAAQVVVALAPPHRSRSLAVLAIAENEFALERYADAEKSYRAVAGEAAHARIARWKLAWCRYLQGDKQAAAAGFGAVAGDGEDDNREEATAMHALALYESGQRDEALQVADRYRSRYKDGRFLDRTERIAARVLQKRGDLAAAQRRLERAAAIAKARGGEAAAAAQADVAEQADLAYQQGDFAAADGLYEQLVARRDALGARALAGRAWCAFELGNDDACVATLGQAKAHPAVASELAGLLELESAVHHRRADWQAAITAGRAFLKQFGEHEKAASIRYALGVALSRKGAHGEARKVLSALLADGGYAAEDRVRYELAWACRRDGDEQAALQEFAKVGASSDDPELRGESRLFVGTALLAEQPPKLVNAREWLDGVPAASSHREQALYRIGFAEFEQAGDDGRELLTAARAHFDAICELDGGALIGEARYLAGECSRRLGDHAGAVQRCQQLLRDEADHPRAGRARLVLGESAVAIDEPEAAIAPLERFLREHDPKTDEVARADAARANLWLGRARLARREHDRAERCFQTVTSLSEGALAAEAQFRLGECRADRGDLDGAADAYVKLPILYADATWVRRGLLQAGLVYEQLKQPQKARRFFDELVEKHAGTDEAKVAAQHRNQ